MAKKSAVTRRGETKVYHGVKEQGGGGGGVDGGTKATFTTVRKGEGGGGDARIIGRLIEIKSERGVPRSLGDTASFSQGNNQVHNAQM